MSATSPKTTISNDSPSVEHSENQDTIELNVKPEPCSSSGTLLAQDSSQERSISEVVRNNSMPLNPPAITNTLSFDDAAIELSPKTMQENCEEGAEEVFRKSFD